MDNQEIRTLALELMDAACERKVAEFELETEDFCVRIKTQGMPPVQMSAAVPAATPEAEKPVPAEETPRGTRVEAPLVGIFYSSPTPEEPPFVEVGQKVHKGDTICIIEAMKTMNEISAPCDGTITRIFVQNGDMVEYKQLICVIE